MSELTLDEAIKHCLEVAEENDLAAGTYEILAANNHNAYEKLTAETNSSQCAECAADHRQLAEWLMELKDLRAEQNDQYTFIRELMDELKEAKRLLKLATDTINHNSHKSCYNCSHFTSDSNCDIGKYLYGTGEKECEWEWKHMNEIIKFLHD